MISEREARTHNDRAWAVWHIAALQRAKRLPKLETLQQKPKEAAAKPKPWQHLMHIAKAWDRRVNSPVSQKRKFPNRP